MILYWGPVLGWMGIIYYLSDIPHLNSGLGVWDFILRKCAHVFMFTVLTGFLIRANRQTWKQMPPPTVARWAAFISVLYAISDEWHQHFVPGRGPSAMDVAIDSLGVLICVIFWLYYPSPRGRISDESKGLKKL